MEQTTYDVAIIGGGPAGSTVAITLAGRGRSVIVLEQDKFPRFHIGESLLPYSMDALDRLGIRDRMPPISFPKYGGEVATACGQRRVKFYFKDGFRLKHHQAYQVERATFDKLLLDRAREVGAEVFEETSVNEVRFSDDDVTLETNGVDGARQVQAKYVIDCSGRHSLLGQHFGLKTTYPNLRKFSCFAHFEGVEREDGIDAGLTRLVRADIAWFWLIPIDAQRTSIGVVMDTAEFKARKLTPEAALQAAIDDSVVMTERMQHAPRVGKVHAIGDYSYRNTSLTGDRWILAGDAAGFIDPIFSTGVFLALHSGEDAADAVDVALKSPRKRAARFRKYERAMHKTMDMYLRFVTAWYRDEFIAVFTTPTQRFQLAPAINAVLAGNLGSSFAIWWRMQVFYLVLFLQQYLPLCPPLEKPGKVEEEPVPVAV
ncbi:MAG: NAD(P)/FAD-dependent oxidoreductase [Chthoniobacteraceae bacterium]